jgi:uncharacterized protein YcbK (DUF882 family)
MVMTTRASRTVLPGGFLTWDEMSCHDAVETPYPVDWRDDRAVVLATVFERIRAAAGNRPLVVLSGYRTPAHNRSVGGARNSQHVLGRALDIRADHLAAGALGDLVRRLATTCPEIGGVGQYPTFVHVDIRPRGADGRVVTWEG